MDEIIYYQPLFIYTERNLFTIIQFSFILERCSKKFFKWWTIGKPTSLHGSFYELRSLNNIHKSSAFTILSIINTNKGCVTLVALPFYIKKELKAKEELWKLKYFTMQKYNLQKKTSKRNQNPSRYYNSITNLKFQHNQNIIF